MIDAVSELVAHRKQIGKLSSALKRVYRFHRANPQVLDFLVSEMREARANGWTKVSLGSLWHYSRWVLTKRRVPGESFAMSNNLFPMYGRIIVILHPDLNGFFEMAKSAADADLGTMLEPAGNNERGYTRRLLWADGRAVEDGWRPTVQHEPGSVSRRKRVSRAA